MSEILTLTVEQARLLADALENVPVYSGDDPDELDKLMDWLREAAISAEQDSQDRVELTVVKGA